MADVLIAGLYPPAKQDEVDSFVDQNRVFLTPDAEDVFRRMDPTDQRRVINDGALKECVSIVAVIKSRVKRAKETEQILTGGKLKDHHITHLPTSSRQETVAAAEYFMHGQPAEVKGKARRFSSATVSNASESNGGAHTHPYTSEPGRCPGWGLGGHRFGYGGFGFCLFF